MGLFKNMIAADSHGYPLFFNGFSSFSPRNFPYFFMASNAPCSQKPKGHLLWLHPLGVSIAVLPQLLQLLEEENGEFGHHLSPLLKDSQLRQGVTRGHSDFDGDFYGFMLNRDK